MITYDAIVIGAGNNGLVTAAYLARAGRYVLLLEQRRVVGGTMDTREMFPGFKYDSGPSGVGWIHPRVIRDLKLHRFGLELLTPAPALFAPAPDGASLLLTGDKPETAAAIGHFSVADGKRWMAYGAHVSQLTAFLAALYSATPPQPIGAGAGDLLPLFGLGGALRQLGRRGSVELLRTLPMSVVEFLSEWFETELLKGALGAVGVTGLFQGPYASGTAYVLLHHLLGSDGSGLRSLQLVRGGTGNLSAALAAAAKRHGVEIRTAASVQHIGVQKGRVTGVVLGNGEQIAARQVISSADPRHTFLDLVDPTTLDPTFLRQVRNIKFRGACAKVNLALAEVPRFTWQPEAPSHLRGRIRISPSLDYLERAFDDAKYGTVSQSPYLEIIIPSLHDPTLAPEGKHVMSIWMQYAPYRLKEGGWTAARREALGEAVVKTLVEYAPNLAGAILHRQVLTPLDLEEGFGLSEGHLYHGELTLDQILFMRPVPGWGQYRTPIHNLYLCGAGTHPGGGVVGASGFNAAREILKTGTSE
jgi:phytoene dehydrogenase-like protein